MYGAKDGARGAEGTFMWFMEEVGELAAALRGGSGRTRVGIRRRSRLACETLANIANVDLEEAMGKWEEPGPAVPAAARPPAAAAR